MSENGAYEGEMNEVALFQSALRAAVRTKLDPSIGTTLVPRLAELARASTIEAEARQARHRPRSRRALVARVGIAIALIPLVLAGLAFAGVTVPSPARSAFEGVGITLPNQPASGHHGTTAGASSGKKSNGSKETTSTTSQSGSKGNSAAAHQHALEQQQKAQGKAVGHSRGNAVGLHGATPPGQAKTKEPGPPAHSNAGGNSATHTTTKPPAAHTPPGHANGHSK